MRRGLMAWDSRELPIEIFEKRLAKVQEEIVRASLDALVLYTNFIRPSAVAHLVGLSPYWGDAILFVPKEGAPTFATTTSKRLANWINSVKPVGNLINTPKPGEIIGQQLAADISVRRLGILELDAFPTGIYEDLAAAAPLIEIVDGTSVFNQSRTKIDASEELLLKKADEIASQALVTLDNSSIDYTAGAIAGIVEAEARKAGAEEVYVALAPDLDKDIRFARLSGALMCGARFAVRASVAYKGAWVRRTRSYSRNAADADLIRRADLQFNAMLNTENINIDLHKGAERIAKEFGSAKILGWIAEATRGSYPLVAVASDKITAHDNITPHIFTLSLKIEGMPWIAAGLETAAIASRKI